MGNPLLALTAIKIGTDLLSGFTAKKRLIKQLIAQLRLLSLMLRL